MGKKINDRQQQVILNYKANGGNMKKAMIDAGYSETYADRNSKYLMGIIGEEIKEQQEEIKSNKIKTVEEIQKWWSTVRISSGVIRQELFYRRDTIAERINELAGIKLVNAIIIR